MVVVFRVQVPSMSYKVDFGVFDKLVLSFFYKVGLWNLKALLKKERPKLKLSEPNTPSQLGSLGAPTRLKSGPTISKVNRSPAWHFKKCLSARICQKEDPHRTNHNLS